MNDADFVKFIIAMVGIGFLFGYVVGVIVGKWTERRK